MLIDTSVWLDLAKDQKQEPVLGVIEEMVKTGLMTILVPRVVLDEFRDNRDRIAQQSAKSLSTHFRLVKEAVGRIGGNKRRLKVVLAHLDDVNQKIPIMGGSVGTVLDRIEKLLNASQLIEMSEPILLRAAHRAFKKQAPFHGDRNCIADAIIIEAYAECVRGKATPCQTGRITFAPFTSRVAKPFNSCCGQCFSKK
jgi:hypothetical protein